MTSITLTGQATGLTWETSKNGSGGEDAVLTFRMPVIQNTFKDVLRDITAAGKLEITVRRKAEHEDQPRLGQVETAGDHEFTFLFKPTKRHTAPPRGAFVITSSGVIGVIVSIKTESDDLFRELVRYDQTYDEHVEAEGDLLTYTVYIIGGMGTDMTGSHAYYRQPMYQVLRREVVYTSPPAEYFALYKATNQDAVMLKRLAIVAERVAKVSPDVAAAMLKNAADAAKCSFEEYRMAVLQLLDNEIAWDAISEACLNMFPSEVM